MKGIQDTSSITYRQLMGNGLRYEVPKFQRDYTWEIEQWDDLWQDINLLQKDEESEHYMGYLVLQSPDNKNWGAFDDDAINRSVYRIGNLTLLENKLNKDAGTEKYEGKGKFYKQSNSKLTNALHEQFNDWTESNVTIRQKELAKNSKSIWKLQFDL